MAYTPKSTLETFQSDWNKALVWANTQHIPRTAWYPVYQLDAQRMKNGYGPMPTADRMAAILASGNPNNVTPLPTNVKPLHSGNFLSDLGQLAHNAVSDVTNIFTGLNPIHLGPALWDMAKNSFEHPAWLLDPTKNTLAQLIPGVADIGQIEKYGFSSLEKDPISSLLDVLPITDGVTSLLGKAGSFGDRLAKVAGFPSGDAMAEAGTIRTALSTVGNLPIPGAAAGSRAILRAGDGTLRAVRETMGGRWAKAANARLLGRTQADFAERMSRISAAASVKLDGLVKKLAEVSKSSSSEEVAEAHAVLTLRTKYKDYAAIENDPTITLGAKQVIAAAKPVLDWMQEVGLAAGDIVKIRMPDGSIEIFANDFSHPVVRARDALDNAQSELERATAAPDAIRVEIHNNDERMVPTFATLDVYTNRIRGAMTNDAEAATNQLLGFNVIPRGEPGLRREIYPDVSISGGGAQLPRPEITATASRLLTDVFADGALLDQAKNALVNDDFRAFTRLAKEVHRILSTKTLTRQGHSPLLDQIRELTAQLHDYAKIRYQKETQFTRLMEHPKNGVNKASEKLVQARADFERAVHDNPSAVWMPLYVKSYIDALMKHEDGVKLMNQALHYMDRENIPHETLDKLRSNPQQLMDLLTVFLKASTSSPFMNGIDESFQFEARQSALNTISQLRAEGHAPHYVPKISTKKLGEDPYRGSTHVSLPLYKPNVSMAKSTMVDTSDSVFDIVASTSYAAKEIIRRDAASELIDHHIFGKLTYSRSDLLNMILKDPYLTRQLSETLPIYGSQEAAVNAIIANHFQLDTFDPYSFGNVRTVRATTGETHYINKDILRGIEATINEGQLPQRGIVASGTRVFRTAILAFSPRYTAHILLGGTFLLGIRDPLALAYIPQAFKLVRGDKDTMAQVATTSTQRGAADMHFLASAAFHEAGGRQLGNAVIQEGISQGLDKARAIANINFRFTNMVTNMQRAMVYTRGISKYGRKSKILDPESGEYVAMTDARKMEEAMRSVDAVMGNLTRMTPLERTALTKIMPFYGWTKHILTYVATYPLDHPYKALILSHLANINSADVPTGLPLRIQNLFFMGHPDAYGNVNAYDVRALNPLRDTANYFSLSGWLSSLNPAITSILSYINPQMTFGGNVLYPNITYDRLYGINEAGPQGTLWTAAEQYIPQIGALDAALQLSSQYKDLKVNNPALFTKTIFEALNIPFAETQHINLRQLAAKNEMDRFNQAKAAAKAYFQSPTPQNTASIAGYSILPNPLNPIYELTPAELATMAENATAATGLPASEVIPQVNSPRIL